MLTGPWRTAGIHHFDFLANQLFSEFTGVVHRGGKENKTGLRAVEGAEPFEPCDDLVHMGTEDAAIGVNLVQDHEGEIGEQIFPLFGIGHDAGVEHVGVCKEYFRNPGSDLFSPIGRGVAIVDPGVDLAVLNALEKGRQVLELILLQGLERKDIEGLGRLVFQDGVEDREIVNQTFSAGRRGGDQDICPFPNLPKGLHLVFEKSCNPAFFKNRKEGLVDVRRLSVKGVYRREVTVIEGCGTEVRMISYGLNKVGEFHGFDQDSE